VLSKATGMLLKNEKGSGAAGGMGMALLALGAKLESGFDFVAQTLKLEDQMKGCDLVITGEGLFDNSSREGKAPVAVAQMAKKMGIPCIAIVGAMEPGVAWFKDVGINQVYALFDKPIIGDEPRKLEVPSRFAEIIAAIFSKKQAVK
jgi:glycerate 2-kinase